MDTSAPRDGASVEAPSDGPTSGLFRQYYKDNDFALSLEGILKVLASIVCIVSSALYLSAQGPCVGAVALRRGGGLATLASAALNVLMYVAVVLELPLHAPQLWLFTDIILSTVMGLLLLVMGVLTMIMCEMNSFISYLDGPIGIVNACMVMGSAVITYIRVMQLWDESRPCSELPQSPPIEHDV